jgi:hypothetical protein
MAQVQPFEESDMLIPIPEKLPALVWRDNGDGNVSGSDQVERFVEAFTEADYKELQDKIKALNAKNDEIQKKITTRDSYVAMMDEQEAKYKTFYQMFENNQERNQSYYKTFLSMLSMVLFLVIIVAIYYHR